MEGLLGDRYCSKGVAVVLCAVGADLLFLYEGDVKGFVEANDLPVVKSPCPVDGTTKREYAKELVNRLNYEYPGAKARMFRAIINGLVNPNCPPVSKHKK